MDLQARIQELRNRVRAACLSVDRAPGSVELLPISKFQPLGAVQAAAAQGFRRFGENYVQEGAAKALQAPGLEFVFTGPLQRNKARAALLAFRELMTVDRPELALRLRHLAAELDLVRPVWIQVDLWGEDTKVGGCPGADLPGLLAALDGDPRLPLRGFMAVPPPDDPDVFLQLARLRETWARNLGRPLLLSMGMSSDLEEAIRAGSDQIRIGTALFGPRP
jgi:PLP dependent protein